MSRLGNPDAPSPVSVVSRWFERAAAAFLVATAGYVTCASIRFIARHRIRLPFWDQWQELLPHDILSRPFSQHNEHRIFVGRLTFALDMWVGRGRGVLSLAVVVVALVATAALLAFAARQAGAPNRIVVAALGVGVTFLLSAYAWEALLAPFNASYVDVCPLAVAAFVVLGTRVERRTTMFWTILCAALAAYSIASGLVVAPLLTAVAALTGRPRRDVVLLGLTSTALVVAYTVGYVNPDPNAALLASLRHPIAVARYLAAYLGAPFRWHFTDGLRAAIIAGAAGIALWGGCAWDAVVRRRNRPEGWTFLGTATFALGWAGMCALGRLKFGIDQAFSARYGTVSLLFWGSLLVDVSCLVATPFARSSALCAGCLVAGMLASEQSAYEDTGVYVFSKIRDAETALVTRGLERYAVDRISPAANLVQQALPELERKRLSVFAEPWREWLGQPLSRHVPRRDDHACRGYLDRARAVRAYWGPAFRVDGWAFERATHAGVARVAIVDRDGTVVGLALGGFPRPEVLTVYPEDRDPDSGFVGHIGELGAKEGRVSALAILSDGRTACALSRSVRLNVERARGLVVD